MANLKNENIYNFGPIIKLLLTAAISFMLSKMFLKSYAFAGGLLVGLVVFLLFSKTTIRSLSLLIFLIPFSATSFFNITLMGIVGAKPINILFIFVLFIALKNNFESKKMSSFSFMFFLIMFLVFSTSIVRSLPYLKIFAFFWGQPDITPVRFILSHYIKPLIYFVPFALVVKYVRLEKDLDYTAGTLVFSLMGVSIFLLYLYIFKCPSKINFEHVRQYFAFALNLHGNDLANFYILIFPIILARFFLKKSLRRFAIIFISILVIGILYSRAAYASFIISTILYFVISKRTQYLPVFFGLLIVLLAGNFYSSIKERALTGIHTGDYNTITAGRTRDIWAPLIDEYAHDHKKLLFGNGRYGTISSLSFKQGMVNVGHPHNMYLEQIVDSGLIGFSLVFYFLMIFIKIMISNSKKLTNNTLKEYQYAIFCSIITFCISGLVGRSFFPKIQNSYLWILLGFIIVLQRLAEDSISKQETT